MVYRRMIRVSAAVTIALGVAIIAVTLASGFGIGVLIGVLFIAAGVGRLYLLRRRS